MTILRESARDQMLPCSKVALTCAHCGAAYKKRADMTTAEHSAEHLAERVEARKKAKLRKGQKLTTQTVSSIKKEIRSGKRVSAIAADFGLSQTMIYFIKSGQSWSHVV